MDSDDRPTGRLLTRRDLVALLGVSGAALATGAGFILPRGRTLKHPLPPCVARPAQTEGPYFVDAGLTRADIRTDPATGIARPGTELALTFLVSRIGPGRCDPLPGALVDIWQCDAGGVYSDVVDPRFNTVGQKFLRGNQTTDANGSVRFRTIYPGWYQGRAVHIHFKIRTDPDADAGFEATSQLFFDDAFSAEVFATGVYAAKGTQDVPNASDGVYRHSGGTTTLDVTREGDTLRSTFSIAIQIA